MSRSYTNRDGEIVEVSQEHLDTAVKIKLELQKSSPSRRTSWAKHRRMMEIEGYLDSENSESYRQMIKAEQKAKGQLPPVDKHADMLSENKLESLKQEIGEISLAKREAQNSFREMNKLKRELSDGILLGESIERALKEKDFGEPVEYTPVYVDGLPKKRMIAVLSDLHYGSKVDVEGFYYDTKIAEELLMEYADKIIAIAEDNNVDNIYVMNTGDLIEQTYLRIQNAYSSERLLAEQITEVSDLIIKFLIKLSKYSKVAYSAISGNHDRLNGNKSDALYGDSAVTVSNKVVETFVKYGSNDNVEYIEAEPYHHVISMNSRNFLFVHGDKTPLGRKTILAEQSTLYRTNFDAIIGGHIHHFTMREAAHDRYVVTFGSLKGADEYSLKTIGTSSSRSQGVVLIDENGEFEIKQVKF